jgi:hypothetical protein
MIQSVKGAGIIQSGAANNPLEFEKVSRVPLSGRGIKTATAFGSDLRSRFAT